MPSGAQQVARTLTVGDEFDSLFVARAPSHVYALPLLEGESASLVVTQRGVDVVVDVRSPDGTLLDSFDSPNGRNGDEPVEIIAHHAGTYQILVRAIDEREPTGRYHLRVLAMRSGAETAALLRRRIAARDSAARWMRPRSVSVPANGQVSVSQPLPALDRLASRVRVLGIGEATHGSREFNDFRVAMTKRLIERFGYRLVAIEASADRTAELDAVATGRLSFGRGVTGEAEGGWIGVRARRDLVEWLRSWNAGHPRDVVHVVGLDPQTTAVPQRRLRTFIAAAYGAEVAGRWTSVFSELLAADSQVVVFGDSYVSPRTRRALLDLVARLGLDAPLLAGQLGRASVDTARSDARMLTEFADFNSDDDTNAVLPSRSRDWYMAARLLEALHAAGPRAKAVYWAHNAHVYAPPNRPPSNRSAGALLRDALGCGYGALGMTFGEGAFVAQIPNDSADRLHVDSLPSASTESIDAMLAAMRPEASATTWACRVPADEAPRWLHEPHAMHWVGGLFSPGSLPSTAYRPYDLLRDFDGIVYFPRVTAEALPPPRPVVPARVRGVPSSTSP